MRRIGGSGEGIDGDNVPPDRDLVLGGTRGTRGLAGGESETAMRVAATQLRGLGWMPCIPFAYSEMTGEPIAQCSSISDQNPCSFGEGPFAYSGYCPAGMPGGLGVLDPVMCPGASYDPASGICITMTPEDRAQQIINAVTGGAAAGDPNAPPQRGADGICRVASGPQAGLVVPCPDVTSIDVIERMPAAFDMKWVWIAGAVLAGVVVVSSVGSDSPRRRR